MSSKVCFRTKGGDEFCEVSIHKLHKLRRNLLEASVRFLKQEQSKLSDAEILDDLPADELEEKRQACEEGIKELESKWLTEQPNRKERGHYSILNGINYKTIPIDPSPWMFAVGLVGVFNFVNIPDTNTFFSCGQALDIGMAISTLKDQGLDPHFEKILSICQEVSGVEGVKRVLIEHTSDE
jgi:hypothetical protein